jgi:hypothetical protein
MDPHVTSIHCPTASFPPLVSHLQEPATRWIYDAEHVDIHERTNIKICRHTHTREREREREREGERERGREGEN